MSRWHRACVFACGVSFVMYADSPTRDFGRLLTKHSALTERGPTLKDLLILPAMVASTLMLLMLLSAGFITTSQDAKTQNPPPFEHRLPVPLSLIYFFCSLVSVFFSAHPVSKDLFCIKVSNTNKSIVLTEDADTRGHTWADNA